MVNISDAKAQLSELVARVQAGETVLIGSGGQPVAVLSRYDAGAEPRTIGGWQGRVRIAEDFDAELPDQLRRAFEGTEP